jgi:hypothetical protein
VPYRDEILADSPVAYWRLGESSGTTAVDQRGLRSGTYVGGPTLGVPGILSSDPDTAVLLNTSQYVTVPDAPALSPEAGAAGKLTLEAWVRLSALPSGSPASVISKGAAGAYEYALRVQPSGAVEVILWSPGGTTYQAVASPSGAVAPGAWYHLAATCQNGVACQVFVNGALRATITSGWGATLPADKGAPVTIGRRGDNTQMLAGTVDEVAIYSTPLSATQIQEHYAARR